MTHDDLISIVRLPANVNADYEADLKELVDRYPYFVTTRVLYVKALQQSHSIHYASNLKIASIYCSSRRWLYFYLHPDKMLSNEPYQHNKNEKSSGDYFDMINRIESVGGDSKQSLKTLAEKLKSAREMVQMPIIQPVEKQVIQNNFQNSEKENPVLNSNSTEITIKHTEEISENNAKRLIIAHKYADAIEILRALNLNNPKKSVYFADQIRFLEKVLANSKK
jgi:hypothetical protein